RLTSRISFQIVENIRELLFAQVSRHPFKSVGRLLSWACEHVAFVAAQLFGRHTQRLGVFIHFLSKVFLLLINEIASRLVSLHGHGLRSGLDLLDRGAPLLPSSTLQGLNFFFCGLCGLLRSLLQTTARGWRCFGRF